MGISEGDNYQTSFKDSYELGIGGLIGQTLILWYRRFPQYLVIIAILGVLSFIIPTIAIIGVFGVFGYLPNFGTSPIYSVFDFILPLGTTPIMELIFTIFLAILSLIFYSIVLGAVIKYALTDYEHPGTAHILESFSYSISRVPTLIITQLIGSLIMTSVVSLFFVVVFFNTLVYFLFVLLVLYLAVRLALSPVVVVANENLSAVSAVRKSWKITGGAFLHTFLSQLLFGILLIMLFLMFNFVFFTIVAISMGSFYLLYTISITIFSLILSPVHYIYLAVLYKDLDSRSFRATLEW